MPYLEQKFKDELDKQVNIDQLSWYMNSLKDEDFAGGLNYLITVIVKRYLKEKGLKYWRLALITGTLECCIKELYRRVGSFYEDIKIKENGDVN